MKRITHILLFCLLAGFAFAQSADDEVDFKRNEVRVGAIKLLAIPMLDAAYERHTNESFSYGTNVIITFNENTDGGFYNFALSPFARMYFNETTEYGNKGIFIEGFAMLNSGKDNSLDLNNDGINKEESFMDFGMGIGVGKKWVNRSGFVFDAMIGLGRNFGISEYSSDFLFKGDLSIGYRF